MPWKDEAGFLATGAVKPAGEALLRLLDERLPVTAYVTDPSEWWPVAGPALVARAGRTLRSVLLLYEHRCDLDAASLTRTLLEQMLRFAYVAHAPRERLMPYESADLRQSEQTVEGVRRLGHQMPARDVWDADQLGPRPRPPRLPVDQLADHADREWPTVPSEFFTNTDRPFRLLYETVYRTASRAVHGSAYVTGPFVDVSRPPTVVVRAAERPTSVIGYECAVWSYALMLVIASNSTGSPSRGAVGEAMAPHITLAEEP